MQSLPIRFNCKEVADILPHRYPFLLVDKVIEMDLQEGTITALKNVTMNESFFQGHFPQAPIMPGVLILEALAQAGGVLIHQKGYTDKIAVLLSVNQAKFRMAVHPGDTLLLHAKERHLTGKGGKMEVKATVDGKVVAEAEIAYALREKDLV